MEMISRDEFDGVLVRLNSLEVKSQQHVPDVSGLREEIEDLTRSIQEISNKGGVSRRDVQVMISSQATDLVKGIGATFKSELADLRRELIDARESAVSTSQEALESRTRSLAGDMDSIRSVGTLSENAAIETIVSSLSAFHGN